METDEISVKYIFKSYYKYSFTLQLETGEEVSNEDATGDDIYRLRLDESGTATKKTDEGGVYYLVDGVVFR